MWLPRCLAQLAFMGGQVGRGDRPRRPACCAASASFAACWAACLFSWLAGAATRAVEFALHLPRRRGLYAAYLLREAGNALLRGRTRSVRVAAQVGRGCGNRRFRAAWRSVSAFRRSRSAARPLPRGRRFALDLGERAAEFVLQGRHHTQLELLIHPLRLRVGPRSGALAPCVQLMQVHGVEFRARPVKDEGDVGHRLID